MRTFLNILFGIGFILNLYKLDYSSLCWILTTAIWCNRYYSLLNK